MRYKSRLAKNVLTLTIHKDHVREELGLAFVKTSSNAIVVEDIFETSVLYGSMLTPGMILSTINKTMTCKDMSVDELLQVFSGMEGSFTMETTSPDGSPLHPWILQQRKKEPQEDHAVEEEINEEPDAPIKRAYPVIMPKILPDDIVVGVTRKKKYQDLGVRFTRIRATRVVGNEGPVASATILVISQIRKGSSFDKTKLQVGMECVIINGFPGNSFESAEDVYEMLKRATGSITIVARKREDVDLKSLVPLPPARHTNSSNAETKLVVTKKRDIATTEEPQARSSIMGNDGITVVSDDEEEEEEEDSEEEENEESMGGGILSMEEQMQQMLQSEHEKSWDRSNIRAGMEDGRAMEQEEERAAESTGPFELLVVNKSSSQVGLHWDDGNDGVLVATLEAKVGEHRVNTYKGHNFFVKREGIQEDSPFRFTVSHAEESFFIPEAEGVQFAVTFVNKSMQSAKLYWDDGADGVLVATMKENGGEHYVNTYKGHSFFACRGEEGKEAQSKFSVSYGDEIFHIPEAKGVAFKVGFINQSKYKVDLVWDDGGEGVVIATLDADGGDHYSTTYNGHSFFVRKHGGSQVLANPKSNIRLGFSPLYADEMFTVPQNASVQRQAGPRRVKIVEPPKAAAPTKPRKKAAKKKARKTAKRIKPAEPVTQIQVQQEENADSEAENKINQMEDDLARLETESNNRIRSDVKSRRSLLAEVKGDMQSRRSLLAESNHSDQPVTSPLVAKRKIQPTERRQSKQANTNGVLNEADAPFAKPSVPKDSTKVTTDSARGEPTTMQEDEPAVVVSSDNTAIQEQDASSMEESNEADDVLSSPHAAGERDESTELSAKDPLSKSKDRRKGPSAFSTAFKALRKPKRKEEASSASETADAASNAAETASSASVTAEAANAEEATFALETAEEPEKEALETSDEVQKSKTSKGARKKFLNIFRGKKGKTGAAETSSVDSGPELEQVYDKEITDGMGFTGKYTGTVLVESGLPHGVGGIDYWMDDECIMATYDGDWEYGCWDGFGESLLKCGDEYTGEFQLHERHGEGEYVWKTQECEDGTRKERYYTGNFESNQRHGFGVFTWRTILPDKKENLSVYKGMYHQGKRQGQGVYSTQTLKYSGEWFQDKYHGMGRLEVFDQFIHRGNFRHGNFVEKSTVPPPFVLASQASNRHIRKRNNMIAELAQKSDDRPKIEAIPNKYESKEEPTRPPGRAPMITADLLAGAQLMKRAPVGDLEPVAISLPPDSVRNPKKKSMLEELGAALKKRDAELSPEKRPIEIVSVPRKVKGPRGNSPVPPSSDRSKSPIPPASNRSNSPIPPASTKEKTASLSSKQQSAVPTSNSSDARKNLFSHLKKSPKPKASRPSAPPGGTNAPPSNNPMEARKNMLAQLSKPPALNSTKINNPAPANPRMNLMEQLSQPPALKSAQARTSPRPPGGGQSSMPPKRKPTMMEELQAKLAAKSQG
eukprot:scaffold331_cov117-Cylindrotheca_fusiformis.AAC.11